jgi:hypothetical protein
MTTEFAPDCPNCAALCCLALAFDAGDMFAHDKAAGVPCHRLAGTSCSIHADLAQKGYKGCVAFDCLGAGQRVTALFTENWQQHPAMTGPMMEAFRKMRSVRELQQMLVAAETLPLPEHAASERQAWSDRLSAACDDLDRLEAFDPAPLRQWLKGLATYIRRDAAQQDAER